MPTDTPPPLAVTAADARLGSVPAGDGQGEGQGSSASVPYQRLFRSLPTSYMVMDRDLVYVEMTDSYCTTTGRSRDDLLGQYVFDAFPPTPDALDETGVSWVQRSFERARDTGQVDVMPLQQYDIPDPVEGGMSQRWWSLISAPICDEQGQVILIAQRAEDVTDWMLEPDSGASRRAELLSRRVAEVEADLYVRARELEAAWAAQQVAAQRLASMAAVAFELSGADSVEDLTRIVFSRGLPVLAADGGGIAVRDDAAGVVRLAVSEQIDAPARQLYAEMPLDSRAPSAYVARTGEPLLLPTTASGLAWDRDIMEQAYTATGRRAWVTLPLRVGTRLLGSMAIGWVEEQTYSPEDIAVMDGFAAQVSQALQRIEAMRAERAAAQEAARMSETLQRSLLTDPPEVAGLSLAVRYQPAAQQAQVGGDWYDVVAGPHGSTLLVVGDVSGHDRTAAAAMGQFRNLLRGIAFESGDGPAALLSRLDRAASWLDVDALATAVLARVERTPAGGARLRWSNAGHPPPLLRLPDGAVQVLDNEPDLLLGLQPDTSRTEHTILLTSGSTLVMFTDGLIERRTDVLDTGIARVASVLERLGSTAEAQAVADAVLASTVDLPEDDVALLIVQVR